MGRPVGGRGRNDRHGKLVAGGMRHKGNRRGAETQRKVFLYHFYQHSVID